MKPWMTTGDNVRHRVHVVEVDHTRHLCSIEALCGATGPVQLVGTAFPVNCPACLRKEVGRG